VTYFQKGSSNLIEVLGLPVLNLEGMRQGAVTYPCMLGFLLGRFRFVPKKCVRLVDAQLQCDF
jgi:hypothetical protein